MQRKDIKVRSSTGGEFDCYLVLPEGKAKVPAARPFGALDCASCHTSMWQW